MAESVVSFLIEKLASLIEQEVVLQKNFREDFTYIRDELESIKVLLKDADAKGEAEHGDQVKLWLKKLRHVAFDIEDMIEEYVFRQRKQQSKARGYGTCGGFIHQIKCFFTNLKAQHNLATQIKGIKVRLQDISSRKDRFNLVLTTATHNTVRDPQADALFIQESKLVGIDGPRDKLISWLLDERKLEVGMLSVFGPGGLGKTTLVRKVYENKKVQTHFPYHAWITVSQTFEIKSLLIQLITVTLNGEEKAEFISQLPTWDTTQLKEKLHSGFQRNRYLIVVDDLWELDAWNEIRSALPYTKCGSRVILTTRFEDVANSCQYKHMLEPLKPDDAWELFQKVAFKPNDPNNSTSTQYSREQSQKFLNKCKGVPLAIVCTAGLLSTKMVTEWDRIYEDPLLDHPQLSDLYTIFSLSYNDLPHHLKSCLMYCSIFPEDYSIQISRLLRLWVAEGFVNTDRGHGVNPSLTKEDVARRYLEELIADGYTFFRLITQFEKLTLEQRQIMKEQISLL